MKKQDLRRKDNKVLDCTDSTHQCQCLEEDYPAIVHESRFLQILKDTGELSVGVSAIEIWIINEKKTRLVRPDGAWWRDPMYLPPQGVDEAACREAWKKLEDPKHEEYIKPQPLQPGVGLAGQLWAERTTKARANTESISSFGSFHGSGSRMTSSFRKFSLRLNSSMTGINYVFNADEALIWRGLQFILSDPDQISDNRLNAFLEAGIGLVAGCPFDLPYSRGIALFYTKSDVPRKALEDERNENFLKRCVPLIGSMLSLSDAMIDSWENKQEEISLLRGEKSCGIVPQDDEENDIKDETALPECGNTKIQDSNLSKNTGGNYMRILWNKVIMMKNKTFDSETSIRAPPPMPNSECLWTFVGSFLTLIAVSYTSEAVKFWTEKQHTFPLGPIGALTTLLFGLTSAPASQPKSAIYGSIIAGVCAFTASFIIPSNLFNLKVALCISIAIALMARLGVTHHPAGAFAIMLLNDDKEDLYWISLFLYLIGVFVAITIATIINNLNEKRTYPQYWSLLPPSFRNKRK